MKKVVIFPGLKMIPIKTLQGLAMINRTPEGLLQVIRSVGPYTKMIVFDDCENIHRGPNEPGIITMSETNNNTNNAEETTAGTTSNNEGTTAGNGENTSSEGTASEEKAAEGSADSGTAEGSTSEESGQ